MSPKEILSIEESAVDSVVQRTEDALSKLRNGAGTVASCPSHEPLAKAIVCIGEMMVPVYQNVASNKPIDQETSIKTKWFTAQGKAMVPICIFGCIACICYTVIKVMGK